MAEPEKSPSYQWFPRDAAADERVMLMTWEQYGIYRFLLDHQSLHGSIPSDPNQLAAMLARGMTAGRLRRLWAEISACFVEDEQSGRLFNRKLRRVLREREEFRAKKSEDGKKGAAAKHGHGSAGGSATGTATSSASGSATQSASSKGLATTCLPVPVPVSPTFAIATVGAAGGVAEPKPRSERDKKLESLADVYREAGLEPPTYAVLGTWLAKYGENVDRLAYQLRDMAGADLLRREVSYSWKVLQSKLSDPWPPVVKGVPSSIRPQPPTDPLPDARRKLRALVEAVAEGAEVAVDDDALHRAEMCATAAEVDELTKAWIAANRPTIEASGVWR